MQSSTRKRPCLCPPGFHRPARRFRLSSPSTRLRPPRSPAQAEASSESDRAELRQTARPSPPPSKRSPPKPSPCVFLPQPSTTELDFALFYHAPARGRPTVQNEIGRASWKEGGER